MFPPWFHSPVELALLQRTRFTGYKVPLYAATGKGTG
jgi:hypothetical protein